MLLRFQTDKSGQAVQPQIRVFTGCKAAIKNHFSVVKFLCSNFNLITAKFSGVPKLRKFTVVMLHAVA